MKWREEWNALAVRIESLLKAASFMSIFFITNQNDSFNIVGKSLIPDLKSIISKLECYKETFSAELPPHAANALEKFLEAAWENKITNTWIDIKLIATLGIFSSEFNYLIHDNEQESRNLIDLAFEHLKRLIVVDSNTKKNWQKAFDENEMACEKLGSVHLLSHGIWAFKIMGAGAATDLVFNEPIDKFAELIKRTGRTLVLTEWKKIENQSNLERIISKAQSQADKYTSGLLGDIELKQTRYIILIIKEDIPAPADIIYNSITYRHIIIPVNPKTPSKAARITPKKNKRSS